MTKRDIKSSMVCETKDGDRYLVIRLLDNGYILMNDKNWILLDSYAEDLTVQYMEDCDIERVYLITDYTGFKQILLSDNLELLWERKSQVDWNSVPVDTKILVANNPIVPKIKRYFAKYEDGKVYAWDLGGTSWSTTECTAWDFAKLAKE